VVLVFGLITIDPPLILLAGFLTYAMSGPVLQVVKRRKKGAA
jgi:CDP-diacylglycerol--serine O-phosphatidyltransferase